MRVAFVYADLLDSLKPIYRACALGLAENVKKAFGQEPIHLTDQKTESIAGTETVRFPRTELPMTWRLRVQALAHDLDAEILFTEPDVRFGDDVSDLFLDKSFDVTVADRKLRTTLKGEEMPPITLGVNCSRSGAFWGHAAGYCSTLGRKDQLWGGDMKGVWDAVNSGKFNIRILDSDVYNRVPQGTEWPAGTRVMHYKGNRKTWLFRHIPEGESH